MAWRLAVTVAGWLLGTLGNRAHHRAAHVSLVLSRTDPLTVTVGQKPAQLGSGTVQLPLVPATDGRNLIFPLAGLRALGCTFTPAGSNVTVACGTASVGLRPIVF